MQAVRDLRGPLLRIALGSNGDQTRQFPVSGSRWRPPLFVAILSTASDQAVKDLASFTLPCDKQVEVKSWIDVGHLLDPEVTYSPSADV